MKKISVKKRSPTRKVMVFSSRKKNSRFHLWKTVTCPYILKITWKPVWYRGDALKIYPVHACKSYVCTPGIYNSAAFYRSDMPYRESLLFAIAHGINVQMCTREARYDDAWPTIIYTWKSFLAPQELIFGITNVRFDRWNSNNAYKISFYADE